MGWVFGADNEAIRAGFDSSFDDAQSEQVSYAMRLTLECHGEGEADRQIGRKDQAELHGSMVCDSDADIQAWVEALAQSVDGDFPECAWVQAGAYSATHPVPRWLTKGLSADLTDTVVAEVRVHVGEESLIGAPVDELFLVLEVFQGDRQASQNPTRAAALF